MATLTETAYYARKTINWGIIGLITVFFFKIVFDFTTSTWRRINPPAPPPPTMAFGKLPAIKWPDSAANETSTAAKLNYTLETIEGRPPAASASGTVFFIPKPAANLLSLTRARQLASKLGFSDEPQAENQVTYRWQDQENPARILKIDIVTGNLTVNYDYASDLSVLSEKNLPTQAQAVAEAKTFLQNLGLLSPSLESGETRTSFWQLSGNNLTTTTSLANADAVRVDLSRENLLGLKLFSPAYPNESVYFVFSGNQQFKKRLLEFSYKFWSIETEQSATYPLKTADQAWEELKKGNGFLVSLPKGLETIIVRKIYLAYYYSLEYQNFLQPIFVFEGDQNFLAYVSAISPAWVAP